MNLLAVVLAAVALAIDRSPLADRLPGRAALSSQTDLAELEKRDDAAMSGLSGPIRPVAPPP